ncbi:dihydrolipoamide acetyltransferase family protein [Sulfurovum sp. NBC37-1]|uniref:dihydrolipoamide acetyltransferase family protein n=1 Tax=Sulfurovum sp. (strain NBC37-1) TaxID=387093 RepID=UPI000158772C|nr:dihydrolipoamide acetyltransferase family protein [Sulfurovum sp. NBC37-1]BAF71925.1 pyruvate/2-oxoglutarate dehydrogenase complex, E2 component, dihydrolipoamide acetyltransferase [Sulfurovum sp. NBC37-1]
MSIFKMPSLGADMESGTLMEWKVKEGEKVKKGQVIAEVESNKGVIEVEVFEDGVVDRLLVEPGTTCDVGTPIAVIVGENETAEALEKELGTQSGKEAAPKVSTETETTEKASEAKKPSKKESVKEAKTTVTKEKPKKSTDHEIKISPAARKKAEELGVDLEALAAKTEGKIGTDEVEAAAKTAKQKRGGSDSMRKAIAAAMSRSNAEIPHYYLSTSINMTPALDWLAEQNEKRSIKERILPAALTIRAVVKALQAVPELNGFWQNDTLQMSEVINPGVAIAKRKGGLVTPALLNAQEMDLDGTMKAFHDLITRTRSGKLRSSEITQQTIVITNLGDIGVEEVLGVIYPPQVALVGLGRIADAPWIEGDALAVRKVMRATLAGDHRATDGRTGALFLNKLDEFLQKPEELL